MVAERRVIPEPSAVPMTPPTAGAQILQRVSLGPPHIDADQLPVFRRSLGMLRVAAPVIFRHDPKAPAGTIEELKYTDTGALYIRACVSHPEARRCNAFSIGGKVLAYRLHDGGSGDFHAEVTDAELEEISITDRPANLHARVMRRYPASPLPRIFDLTKTRVEVLIRLVALIPETAGAATAAVHRTRAAPRPADLVRLAGRGAQPTSSERLARRMGNKMTNEIKTGPDAIRAGLFARAHKGHLAYRSRDLGVGLAVLDSSPAAMASCRPRLCGRWQKKYAATTSRLIQSATCCGACGRSPNSWAFRRRRSTS